MSESAVDLILKYSQYSVCVREHETDKLERLAAVIPEFLITMAQQFVYDRIDEPLLVFGNADSTPHSTKERIRRTFEQYQVRRTGMESCEYLGQILFVMDLKGGARVVFEDPLRMKDKIAWTHFACIKALFPLVRELGHRGPLLTHHCWDRALFSALRRIVRKHHRAHDVHLANTRAPGEAKLLTLLSIRTQVFLGFRRTAPKSIWLCSPFPPAKCGHDPWILKADNMQMLLRN